MTIETNETHGYRLRTKFLRKENHENETCDQILKDIEDKKFSRVHSTVLLNDNPYSWDIPDISYKDSYETQNLFRSVIKNIEELGCEFEQELCLTEKDNGKIDLSVLMNTENEEKLDLEIEVKSIEDFIKNIDEEFEVNVTIGSSYVYRVNLTGITGSLLINVSSPQGTVITKHLQMTPLSPFLVFNYINYPNLLQCDTPTSHLKLWPLQKNDHLMA